VSFYDKPLVFSNIILMNLIFVINYINKSTIHIML